MTREVYSDKTMVEFSRRQIFVRIFVDNDPQGESLASKFKIRGYPTILVLDSSGREVDRITGFRRARDLIEELQEIFDNAPKKRLRI